MLYCRCDWSWVLIFFKREWEWIGNFRELIQWMDCRSWTSEIPVFLSIQPHLSGPTPISPPFLGCCIYKQRGNSVLQVSLVRLCVLATLKSNPSYLQSVRLYIRGCHSAVTTLPCAFNVMWCSQKWTVKVTQMKRLRTEMLVRAI